MPFSTVPNGAKNAIKPFTVSVPQQTLDDMRTLLTVSRIALPSYENTQSEQEYGVSRKWMESIKEKWIDFDW
jgi:microsomal epoxide hydrolase